MIKHSLNIMLVVIAISIAMVHCATGKKHDFGEGECDIEHDE